MSWPAAPPDVVVVAAAPAAATVTYSSGHRHSSWSVSDLDSGNVYCIQTVCS